MWSIQEFSYTMQEKEFVSYFDRCRERANMEFYDIEKILPQIQNYHDDMVKEDFPFHRRTLKELFDECKQFSTSPWK